jgi:hypothetical protein
MWVFSFPLMHDDVCSSLVAMKPVVCGKCMYNDISEVSQSFGCLGHLTRPASHPTIKIHNTFTRTAFQHLLTLLGLLQPLQVPNTV